MANTQSLNLEKASSQYAYKTDSASLSITGDISIEAWIKLEELPSASGTVFGIAGKYQPTSDKRSYMLIISNADDKMYFYASQDGTDTDISVFKCDTAFAAGDVNVWRHVAVTVDISDPSVTFYIDGVAKADTSTSTNATAIHDNDSRFAVGANDIAGTPTQFFDGNIDEVRIWNDIRTATEISLNKDTELTGTETGLAAYYKFNGGYEDTTSNGNHLTSSGTPVFQDDIPFGKKNNYSFFM